MVACVAEMSCCQHGDGGDDGGPSAGVETRSASASASATEFDLNDDGDNGGSGGSARAGARASVVLVRNQAGPPTTMAGTSQRMEVAGREPTLRQLNPNARVRRA